MMKGNIRKYYFYNFFRDLAFFSPVIVLFWQSRGLNMTQIMILQSIYAIAIVILELPTGALADYLGKRTSLILGAFSFAIASFFYAFSFKFWQFALCEITAALGMAFVSGADSAFIHETLKSIGQESHYKKVSGRAEGFRQIAQTIGNLVGGFIGSFSLALTLVATGGASLIASIISFFFVKTKEKLPREEKTEYLKIIKESLVIIKDNRQLLWLSLFYATFNGLVLVVNWFSQPYLQLLKVPVVYFGLIFAAFSLVTAIGSAWVHRFEKLTRGRPFLVMSLIASISMLFLSVFPRLYIFPLWSLFMTFAVMNRTLISSQVLALVPSKRAATILSFQNLLRRLVYAVFGPVLGMVSDHFGTLAALQLNAIVLFLTLGLLRFSHRKILSPS